MSSFRIRLYLRWCGWGALSGVISGSGAALFLKSLAWVSQLRDENPRWILFLPLTAFFIYWVYRKWGQNVDRGSELILEEMHDPKNILPVRMTPFVWLASLLSHAVGASVGREGAAVQVGTALSDQLSRIFKIDAAERKILLVTGAGASFGAALGAPWAGVIFGMELMHVGKLVPFAVIESFLASWVAYGMCKFWGVHHSTFPLWQGEFFNLHFVFWILLIAPLFGLMARLFIFMEHLIKNILKTLNTSWLPGNVWGATILVLFFIWEGSYRYMGLGLGVIQESFLNAQTFQSSFYKMFATSLSIASGFKGGEFVPLVFMGSTFGSALSLWIPLPLVLLAALGFSATFAGAANTPWSCILLSMELFGSHIGLYAFIACHLSCWISGRQGIYKGQKFGGTKFSKPF